jgi:S1-C subfamily serine protease
MRQAIERKNDLGGYVREGTLGLFLTVGLMVSLVPCAHSQQQSQSELVKASVDSVVLIVMSDENGKPTAEGSGFIVSSDGKIVTNHHVIAAGKSAIVKLNNGAFFAVAGILADDPDHDLAVIKVSGKNLPALALANASGVAVGDHVLAIGSPLGLENSVSDGIVSAIREDRKGKSWIQTTAFASHGNSGGPLLIMDGKVAGVIAWKVSEGENLNFAIPSKFVAALLEGNSTPRPLGDIPKSDSTKVNAPSSEALWNSLSNGWDYKIRIDGDYVYVQWVNLPSDLKSTAAFASMELKKTGTKWAGKKIIYLPFNYKYSVKWCRTETAIEIDQLSESRIQGRSEGWTSLDVKKCQPENIVWKDFTWIPQ